LTLLRLIAEYALEPEMVAAWCRDKYKCCIFRDNFGPAQGRLVSRYPKKWVRKVWDSFSGGSVMERKRLEELLARLLETPVKRKDCHWDDSQSWLDNAVQEHARYPFRAILARKNPASRPEILGENAIADSPCPGWESPHGRTVSRKASEMAAAVKQMLSCCHWAKFIDPYFSADRVGHKKTFAAFLKILATDRPVGPPETIEIHTKGDRATNDHLEGVYRKIIPAGMQVTLYRWSERPGAQKLHNRYILTNIGGVSFHHGLDEGRDGEADDITRLDLEQYSLHCKQYNPMAPAFDPAANPIVITGKYNRKK
jgi:hypothetical protein